MRKRSGQVHSRESSATLQLTVSLLYPQSLRDLLMDGCRRIIKKNTPHLYEQAPTVQSILFYCMACSLAKVSL